MKNIYSRVRIIFPFLIFSFCCYIFYSCSEETQNLKIAVAANAQFAIKEIAKSFEVENGIKCEVIIGSSGSLTAQIINGAPYNLFLSADMKYPEEIFSKGLSDTNPKVYAFGKLVLWSHMDDLAISKDMLLSSVKKIAIGNPHTAPYGSAAFETLSSWGLEKKLSDKLVYGESISQVNHFILSKSVDVGFTSYSSILANHTEISGSYEIVDSTSYKPIAQGIVLINKEKEMIPIAKKFYDYIYSSKGKSILHMHGYRVDYE